jgi:predicted metal-dependent phosphoesterase TrpH
VSQPLQVQSRFVEPVTPSEPAGPANRVDLHCHSDRSDGVLAPLQLHAAMREVGLRVAAIADHDTLNGYRELAALHLGESAGPAGPRLIPAVEINSVADPELLEMGVELEEGELHMLGYGVDPADEAFEEALVEQRGGRRRRILLMVDRLRELDYPIDDQIEPALASEEAIGRPHVARALVSAGHVASVQEAFDRLIDRHGAAYVPRQGLGTRRAIEAIRACGGLAVLAHYPAAPEQPQLIDLLMDWGVTGLEVYYRRFEPATVTRMAELARRRSLLATGGSDYHGDTMSYAEAQLTTHVPEAVADSLLEAIAGTRAAARR